MAFQFPSGYNTDDTGGAVAVLTASSTVILGAALIPWAIASRRKKLVIVNPITNVGNNLLLTFSTTVFPNKATPLYEIRLAPGDKYEDIRQIPYQGQVNGQFDNANANCMCFYEE